MFFIKSMIFLSLDCRLFQNFSEDFSYLLVYFDFNHIFNFLS
jgi:hypothetical protein